jgi:hypothetical protein
MKKLMALAIVLLAMSTRGNSADRRNFWLLNNTGRTITSFFVAVHGSEEPWGSDVLGTATLPTGVGTVVYFSDYNTSCMYDFRVGYSDGSHQDYLRGRNVCQSHAVQFNQATNDAY